MYVPVSFYCNFGFFPGFNLIFYMDPALSLIRSLNCVKCFLVTNYKFTKNFTL
uniref:Uncharacterized protein n=1 Tax=Rhizophora mucronata TaxID=61149 RepID=A0A2P2NRZ3_RHIMU